ncbi:MAG: hypothetical protein OXF20_03240 [Gammaproteobacteria bacterium]|nr:hypothetical protein [Gammaproteobacteria bacterium]
MLVSPSTDKTTGNGRLKIDATGLEFVKYFPEIDEAKAREFEFSGRFIGDVLDQRLDEIKRF